MFIETTEAIRVEKDIFGSQEVYFPGDIIEVEYREEASAVLPQHATGRFDSIRYSVTSPEKKLYLDVSDKYQHRIIKIPITGIADIIRRDKK